MIGYFTIAGIIANHLFDSDLTSIHERPKMKHTNNYQLPLRLNDTLAEQLHEVSEITGIQNSKICRMGISRIVIDMKQMNAFESVRDLNKHYQEIQ